MLNSKDLLLIMTSAMVMMPCMTFAADPSPSPSAAEVTERPTAPAHPAAVLSQPDEGSPPPRTEFTPAPARTPASTAVLPRPDMRPEQPAAASAVLSRPEPSPERPAADTMKPSDDEDEDEDQPVAAASPSPKTTDSLADLPPVTTTVDVTRLSEGPAYRINIDGAVLRALSNNPGLRASVKDIEAARWRYYQQRASVTPTLDYIHSYTNQRQPPAVGPFPIGNSNLLFGPFLLGASNLEQSTLVLKHTLYTFGRQSNSLKQRRKETQAATETYWNDTDELALSVKVSFYAILLQRELILTAEQNLKELKLQYDYAAEKLKEGAATQYDVLLARAQLANGKPALIAALHQLEIASRRLLSLLALDETVPVDALGAFDDRPVRLSGKRCVLAAFVNRNDLRALLSQRMAFVHAANAAKANHYPILTGFAELDTTRGYRPPTDHYVDLDAVGVSIDLPLFDGGASKALSRERRALVDRTDERIENLKLRIREQVTTAYLQVEQASGVKEAALESITAATRALSNAEQGFKAGIRTSLDVLTAETQLNTARTNLAQARHDYSVAKATLTRVTRVDVSNPPNH